VNELTGRSAREVLDDHLGLSQQWTTEAGLQDSLEDDLRRNVSEDVVVIMNRGVFRGHEGVRELARALAEELPDHRQFQYTFVAAEGRMGFLEWIYEDTTVRVRDGVDSYLIEAGKIVIQTIHYTLEPVAGRSQA
jgi:SnoaL-like protein